MLRKTKIKLTTDVFEIQNPSMKDFSHMTELRKVHDRSFQRPFLIISMQSLSKAHPGNSKLGSPGCQLEKFKSVFEWSHIYCPSFSRSLQPVHAVQSNGSAPQLAKNESINVN